MVLTRCLRMEQFYAAVDWRTIFLVAGMLPLSLAITETGLADRVGAILELSLMNASPLLLFAVIALLTMLVVQVIGGQVTPLLVGPIAIKAALQMGIDPRAMALAVAMAARWPSSRPISHPVKYPDDGTRRLQVQRLFQSGHRHDDCDTADDAAGLGAALGRLGGEWRQALELGEPGSRKAGIRWRIFGQADCSCH